MKNKSENRTMNAYFCAVTFCFPPPKPLPLPLLVLLPASLIATGGLGFPVFLFEDARILFFFFFKCVTSSFYLLLFAFLQQRSLLSVLSSLQYSQKNRRNLNEQRTRFEFLFFSITQRSQHNVLLNNSIKTDFTGQKRNNEYSVFTTTLIRVFVLLKECAEQTRIPSSSSHVRLLRRNGDLFP